MSEKILQLKRGTAERWYTVNPILAIGEPGFVYDANKLKIGDGVTPWNELPYIEGSTGESVNLVPVDGSLIIKDNTIDIGISAEPGNALTKKADGLYVGTSTSGNYAAGLGLQMVDGTFSVKLAPDAHGLTAVDGALTIALATTTSDGAMSKEDKMFLDALKALNISTEYATKDEVQVLRESVAELAQAYVWEEI
jgi:hypothetical protein